MLISFLFLFFLKKKLHHCAMCGKQPKLRLKRKYHTIKRNCSAVRRLTVYTHLRPRHKCCVYWVVTYICSFVDIQFVPFNTTFAMRLSMLNARLSQKYTVNFCCAKCISSRQLSSVWYLLAEKVHTSRRMHVLFAFIWLFFQKI